MVTVGVDDGSLQDRWTHSPSWLAWSEGWRPLGAQVCNGLIEMNRVNSHSSPAMMIALLSLLLLFTANVILSHTGDSTHRLSYLLNQ